MKPGKNNPEAVHNSSAGDIDILRSIAKYIPDVIWITDKAFSKLDIVSPAYEELWGRSAEKLAADPLDWMEGVLEGYRKAVWEKIEQTVSGDDGLQPLPIEFPIRHPAQGVRWIRYRTVQLPEEEGKPVRILSLSADLTSEKVSVESLLQQARLSNIFMEAMPCYVVLLDRNRTILACNQKASDIGASPGQKCHQGIFALEHQCPWCKLDEVARMGEPVNARVSVDDAVFDAYWVPVEKDIYLHYAFNITEQDKLDKSNRRMDKLESLGVLAGTIAHDFNNLLMGIMGNTGLARLKLPIGSPLDRHLEQVENSARLAADLTNQMLFFSGKGSQDPSILDSSDFVDQMRDLLKSVVSKDVDIIYKLEKDIPKIKADSSQLSQVMMNLVKNASDACGDISGGRVNISTGSRELTGSDIGKLYVRKGMKPGPHVFLEVSDNGCGMDEKTQGSIFEPFFTTKSHGRGFGLAGVLGILKGHNGGLQLETVPGKGSNFRVYLPVTGEVPAPSTEIKRGTRGWRGQGLVLVVDDEESIRSVSREILEMVGFKVITASDGQNGVEIFLRHRDEVGLVLLDMTMPRLSGTEALKKMREIRPDINVILMSGYAEDGAGEKRQWDQLTDFLKKPFLPEELIDKVRRAMGDTDEVQVQ